MRKLLYIVLVLSFFSCRKSVVNQEIDKEGVSLKITKEDISNLQYDAFVLDSKTKNAKEFWQKYADLNNIVFQINQADLSFFKENNEALIAFVKDLKETLPEEINTPLINARLLALETKMLKLEGVVNLTHPNKQEVLLVVRDFLIAFSNLNLQINKKIEKESQNIEKPY